MSEISTRERIVAAANRLFYREGIGRVSVDAIAEEAGLTKRSLYYHFRSKDDLVAAYLDYRDLPNLSAFRKWFGDTEGAIDAKIAALFDQIAETAAHPKWKGCGFLRTAAELVNLPGHPALKVGADHKKKVEAWLASCLSEAGIEHAGPLSRQIRLLLDGAFSVAMLHRDPSYFTTAGEAARSLVQSALARSTADP
jgi:AcrR family transcriptional regulator